jgi:hypothetical protein
MWALDLLLALLLCVGAFPIRWAQTHGDFWFDEADYAQAAVRGFEANRWDRSDDPEEPEKLLRFRHYHPPLVAQVLGLVEGYGRDERTLRLPFVLSGCLTVGLLYLCGLALFRGRKRPDGPGAPLRGPALAAAVILIFTPAHIRASSHAIPWSLITLWLAGMLATVAAHARRPHAGWLALLGTLLGAMAVTSEYLLPAILMCAAGLIYLLILEARRGERWIGRTVQGLLMGGALFAAICSVFWPAGALGGAGKVLEHYVEMADSNAFPVVIEGHLYQRAPKWAYLYWYWTEFPTYLAFYAAGLITALAFLARRRLDPGYVVLGVFVVVILGVAHRAHIIGPEYLSHALPFLTLLGMVPLAAIARARPIQSLPVLAACCWILASSPQVSPLAGMDPRSRLSRWPAAAQFLAAQWSPGDRLIASQYAVAAKWYLLHAAHAPAQEDDIRMLPAGNAKPEVLQELLEGRYRWVVVWNAFTDWTEVDNRIRMLLRRWPVAWRSDEHGTSPSRLIIYERPPGVSPRHPLRRPWPPETPPDWVFDWLPE